MVVLKLISYLQINKKSIVIRIILINFALLILFTAFVGFNIIYFKNIIYRQNSEASLNELNQVASGVNKNIREIKDLMYMYASELNIIMLSGYNSEKIKEDSMRKLLDIRNDIKLLKKSRSDIHDIYIFFKRSELFVNTEGTGETDVLFNTELNDRNGFLYQFANDTLNLGKVSVTHAFVPVGFENTQRRVALYVYPIGDAVIMLGLNEGDLDKELDNYITHMKSYIVVMDANREIYASNLPMAYRNTVTNKFTWILEDDGESITINGGEYYLWKKSFADTGMTYVLLQGKDTLINKMNRFNLYGLCFLIIFLAIDVCIFLFLNYKLYIPVKAIVHKFNLYSKEKKGCEYDILEQIMSDMHNKMNRIEAALVESENEVRDYNTNKILFSLSENRGKESLTAIKEEEYFVIFTCITENMNGEIDIDGAEKLHEAIADGFQYRRLFSYPKQQTYLILLDQQLDYKYLLIQAMSKAHENNDFLLAGVSTPRRSLNEIRTSFSESQAALYNQKVGIKEINLSFYEMDARVDNETFGVNIDVEKKLINTILQGEILDVKQNLECIYKENEYKTYRQRKALYGYLTDLLFVIINSKKVEIETFLSKEDIERLLKIQDIYNVNALEGFITDCFAELTLKLGSEKDELIDMMARYIDEHYAEDLSLDILSDVFGMSPGYISQYFKNTLKINFVHYVQSVRIEEAKKLLEAGDAQINEVAKAVGFDNVGTFIRIFKKKEGMTPGEYKRRSLAEVC